MKRFFFNLSLLVLSFSLFLPLAEAKRLGGSSSMGMKRNVPARTTPSTPPAAQAQPAPATPAATAATPKTPAPTPSTAPAKRSWLAPLAGLAAGLGLAALLGHLGLGSQFASFLMWAAIAVAGFMLIRFLMRRFMPQANMPGLHLAGAGAGASPSPQMNIPAPTANWGASPVLAQGAVTAPNAALNLPSDFDVAAFERVAKLMFIRLQAANDTADLNDLRAFTTPEMFAAAKLDLQERGNAVQHTDVVTLEAELLEASSDSTQQIVSMRFHGLIREDAQSAAVPFDEVWHLVRPLDASREWAIAGIAPYA